MTGPQDADDARSVARLLRPTSIAVVGAGRSRRSIGRAILTSLLEGDFVGPVYPVNPNATSVGGVATYPDLTRIPGRVDLAIVAVPAPLVPAVLRDCAAKGVTGVVVISAGFAELGDGDAAQDALVTFARGHGMRLVGPNCFGIVNTNPAVRMNATFSPVSPRPGRVAVATQSGGVGIELLSRVGELDVGVSSFVSLGNRADVSSNDLLRYWADDPDTDVVLLYLESFGNPRTFARVAPAVARRKPVIAMKSGRTAAGARGARSHTAALADADDVVDVLLRQTGVLRVDTLEEMLETTAFLAHQPVPAGRRLAVMTNGGGPGILAADAATAAGADVPELTPALQDRLRAIAPPGAGVHNPVDLVAAAGPDTFRQAGVAILESGEVDALLVIFVAPQVTDPASVRAAIAEIGAAARGLPVAACILGPGHPHGVLGPDGPCIPTFEYPEAAARAIARAGALGEWRARPEGHAVVLDGIDAVGARELIDRAGAGEGTGGWLRADTAAAVLRSYGIPVAPTILVGDAAEAARVADELGRPVALKAASPALVHKTDIGGVRLGLQSVDEVGDAYRQMEARLGPAMGGAIVQPMAPAGIELLVGVTRDPSFGPLVVLGAGGTTAELLRDTAVRMPPLRDVDVDEMIHALRLSPLLFGYRGAPPVDTADLADILARVGRLAEDFPDLAELDCNPVIVSAQGAVAVDVKLRVSAPPA